LYTASTYFLALPFVVIKGTYVNPHHYISQTEKLSVKRNFQTESQAVQFCTPAYAVVLILKLLSQFLSMSKDQFPEETPM